MLAVWFVLRDGMTPRSAVAPTVWAALVLAVPGHALAIHFIVALIAWSAVHALRRGYGWPGTLSTLAWWYAVPVAARALSEDRRDPDGRAGLVHRPPRCRRPAPTHTSVADDLRARRVVPDGDAAGLSLVRLSTPDAATLR